MAADILIGLVLSKGHGCSASEQRGPRKRGWTERGKETARKEITHGNRAGSRSGVG
jgi:hypothetical protein